MSEGVNAPVLEPGREGVRLAEPSLKLEGGNLLTDARADRPIVPLYTGTCCTRALIADSGVCARVADCLNAAEGLSDCTLVDMDIEVEGLEGVDSCTLGIGIMDRLGGLGGGPPTPDIPVEAVLNAGENARCINDVGSSSSPPASDDGPVSERSLCVGAGM